MTLKNLNFSEEISSYLFTGTVVDSGVFAPVLTFQKLFKDEGVPITSDEVRAPMGVHKRVRRKITTYLFTMRKVDLWSFFHECKNRYSNQQFFTSQFQYAS